LLPKSALRTAPAARQLDGTAAPADDALNVVLLKFPS